MPESRFAVTASPDPTGRPEDAPEGSRFSLAESFVPALALFLAVPTALVLVRDVSVGVLGARSVVQVVGIVALLLLVPLRHLLNIQLQIGIVAGVLVSICLTSIASVGFAGSAMLGLPLAVVLISVSHSPTVVRVVGTAVPLLGAAAGLNAVNSAAGQARAVAIAGSSINVIAISVAIAAASWVGLEWVLRFRAEREEQIREAEARNRALEEALAEIETLRGILPICAYCGKVRDENDGWEDFQRYVASHTKAKLSHGVCPTCETKLRQEYRLG